MPMFSGMFSLQIIGYYASNPNIRPLDIYTGYPAQLDTIFDAVLDIEKGGYFCRNIIFLQKQFCLYSCLCLQACSVYRLHMLPVGMLGQNPTHKCARTRPKC